MALITCEKCGHQSDDSTAVCGECGIPINQAGQNADDENYIVLVEGVEFGPIDLAGVQSLLAEGKIDLNTPYAAPGMTSWQPVKRLNVSAATVTVGQGMSCTTAPAANSTNVSQTSAQKQSRTTGNPQLKVSPELLGFFGLVVAVTILYFGDFDFLKSEEDRRKSEDKRKVIKIASIAETEMRDKNPRIHEVEFINSYPFKGLTVLCFRVDGVNTFNAPIRNFVMVKVDDAGRSSETHVAEWGTEVQQYFSKPHETRFKANKPLNGW